MTGLTILVARVDGLRPALELAAAHAALGGSARLFAQSAGVAGLRRHFADPGDTHHHAAGLPTLAELVDDALALGVTLLACQSGLALAGLRADQLDPRIGFGGLVSLLQTLGEDRLVAF